MVLSQKAEHVSQKAEGVSQKGEHMSQKAEQVSRKAEDISQKAGACKPEGWSLTNCLFERRASDVCSTARRACRGVALLTLHGTALEVREAGSGTW